MNALNLKDEMCYEILRVEQNSCNTCGTKIMEQYFVAYIF